MKMYYGSKLLNATPMTRLAYKELRNWALPPDEDGADEGYLVEYKDGGNPNHANYEGYISWSPKLQFEAVYREIDGMTFGLAVEGLKRGCKVARKGWNGRQADGTNMFVYLVPAKEYPAYTEVAKAEWGEDGLVPYNAYLAIKTAAGSVSTWAPSCSDALAEDWMIL
jgi:hypothetical protein